MDRDVQLPLPGANVVVEGTDPLVGTTTDAEGWFVLENVPLGRQVIRVSFLGYDPAIIPQVLVTSGREVVLTVRLRERVLQGDEVVVVPEAQKREASNDLALVSARSFSVEETRRYAGGFDDPARMASAFAGITTGGGVQENAMIIRGNAPKGVIWRLEGVEIPNPSHFANLSVAGGGGLTLFSGQLLSGGDFFTGAFPAEYGNALAGVFDVSFRTGNRAKREYTLQAGLLGIEAAAEGPFRAGRTSTYLFNYRYSTLGLLLPLLPTEDVATYQDLSLKVSIPTRRFGRFDLWGIGGLDRQSMSATEDSSKWEYEVWDRQDSDLHLAIGASGISHNVILGRRSYLQSVAAWTINRTTLDQRRLGDDLLLHDDLLIHNTDRRLIVGSSVNHKFGAPHTNRTGFVLQRLFYDMDVSAAIARRPPPVPVALGSGTASLVQLFSQSRVALGTTAVITAGVHTQHFSLTGHTSLEPRVGIRFTFLEGQALSVGYGLHSQIEDLRIYFARAFADPALRPNRSLDFARAHHLVVSYDRQLGRHARMKLELYGQQLFGVPVVRDSSFSMLNFEQDFTFSEALVNEGAGKNFGLEMTLERFLQDGYYYLFTGSLFRSRYRGGDDVWRDTRFDRIYAVNGLFGREFAVRGNNLLGVNGRLAVMGGKRRSPVDPLASRAAEEVVFDAHRAFEEREPALAVVDLTITYRRNHTRRSEVWALQVKNLLAAKDISLDYNFARRSVDEVKEGFPLPILSYKVEF